MDDLDGVVAAGADWVHRTLGADVGVRIVRPDGSGRLRVVWSNHPHEDRVRRHPAKRRQSFDSLTPIRLRLDGEFLAMIPLRCRDEAVGILEVSGPDRLIDPAWDVLEAGAIQLGVALQAAAQNMRLRRQVEALEQASHLGPALVRAGTADEAVRVAVRFVWDRFRVPVAGWCSSRDGVDRLVEVQGLGSRRRSALQRAMATQPPWGWLDSGEREVLIERFRGLTGARRVSALDARDAVLLFGEPRPSIEGPVQVVGPLLAEVLPLLDVVALAQELNRRLDMGLAWTAHELRGPLLGVRAALDVLLERHAREPAERAVLRTSLQELDRMAGSAEAILSLAVEHRSTRRGPVDLVQIVEEVVDACALELDDPPILVTAPEQAVGRFDRAQIRAVVWNLIRNALAYSFPGTKVEVAVEHVGEYLTLSVRDEGPEVPAEERRLIFEPFARGGASRAVRDGSGLGLFIARRVVEAHQGRIWVESADASTTFHVRLPVEERSPERCAS